MSTKRSWAVVVTNPDGEEIYRKTFAYRNRALNHWDEMAPFIVKAGHFITLEEADPTAQRV